MHHGTELFERSKVMGRGGARCEGACLHVFLRPIRSDDDDQKIRPPMLAAAIIETYDAQNEASTTACAAQRSTLESMRRSCCFMCCCARRGQASSCNREALNASLLRDVRTGEENRLGPAALRLVHVRCAQEEETSQVTIFRSSDSPLAILVQS